MGSMDVLHKVDVVFMKRIVYWSKEKSRLAIGGDMLYSRGKVVVISVIIF